MVMRMPMRIDKYEEYIKSKADDNSIVLNIDKNGKTVVRISINVDYFDGDENANVDR